MRRYNLSMALALGISVFGISGCNTMPTVGGSSESRVVTGGANEAGATGEKNSVRKCSVPKGNAVLSDGSNVAASDPQSQMMAAQMKMQKQAMAQFGGLPDPIPLLRVVLLQSGCFKLQDRGAGLAIAEQERALASRGIVKKANAIAADAVDYVIVAEVAIPEQRTGGMGAGMASVGSMFGLAGTLVGAVAGSIHKKEAQVTLTVTNVSTLSQTVVTGESSAFGFGGGAGILGRNSVGLGAWKKSPHGEVVVAAFVDAANKLQDLL